MKLRALVLTIASITLVPHAHAQPAGAPAEPAPPPTTPPPVTTEPPPTEPPPVAATTDEPSPPPEDPPAKSLAPTITGFIDGTYNYNFNHPAGGVTPFHSYDARHNTFLLNSAHVELNGSDDQLGYSLQVDSGTDAVVDSGGSYFDIQEAFVTYAAKNGWGVKLGKFVTYHGIEVIESGSNPTISRGFLYGLAEPFTHVGALITKKVNDQIDVAFGAVNGWDQIVDNNSMKTIVGKLGYTSESLLFTLSAYAGPEKTGNNDDWRISVDGTGDYKMPKADIWFQVLYGTEQGSGAMGGAAAWFGVGVQPVFKLDDQTSIGARVELLDDLDGNRSGLKQMLVNVSAAPAYKVTDHLTLRAELRADLSTGRDDGVTGPFVDKTGEAKDLQVEGLTEAIVSF